MGNKGLFVQTENTVPTENDKFSFANAENNNQVQSCRTTELRSGIGQEVSVEAFAGGTTVTTGDGAVGFVVPASLNGAQLYAATISFYAAAGSGASTVMIRKSTAGVDADMLSSAASIAASAFTTSTIAIDTAEDDVATGDIIFVDVDSAGNTPAPTGLFVTFLFHPAS